jgi:hypothetical protein
MFALIAAPIGAEEKKETKPAEPAKNAALERIKKLAGEWVGNGPDGKPMTVSVFKITAGGSAVQETLFPGTPMEMVTVYHMSGGDLVLTHYCMLGNQPHLKLDPKSPANKMHFMFVGGTNLNPAKDMHMHEGTITFIDDDHIESAWVGYQDGKPAEGHKAELKLTRKK